MSQSQETLSNLLQETRRFAPPADLAASANVTADAYEQAAEDSLGFWAEQADRLAWTKRWDDSSTGATRRSPSGTWAVN